MKIVRLDHLPANEILELVGQLKKQGYCQGSDFDFAYHQSHWDGMIGEIPRHTVFTFYNEQLATWFALKFK